MFHLNRLYLLLIVATLLAVATSPVYANKIPELVQFSSVAIHESGRDTDKRLTVEAFEQRFVIHLSPNENLPPDRSTALYGASPDRNRYAFYKGELEGAPGSWARINRIGDDISGMFYDGIELYLIDQASSFALPADRPAGAESTIVFRLRDIRADWLFDHGGVFADADHDNPAQATAPSTAGTPGLRTHR